MTEPSAPPGNLMQRVFDALADRHPEPMTIFELYAAVAADHRSVQCAIKYLRALKQVDATPGRKFTYQVAPFGTRPVDRRGWRKGGKRK